MRPTEEQIATALLAAANAGFTTARVTAPDKVAGKRPDEYVTLTVVRRGGGTARGGRHATTGWAAYFMAVSRYDVDNARHSLARINAQLENNTLLVDLGGDATKTSTPITFASGRPVAEDDGWFSGVHVYNFAV